MKKVLAEAVLVAITGIVCAFAANALSSKGIQLTRNYFPGSSVRSIPTHAPLQKGNPVTTKGAAPVVLTGADAALERLRQKGFQVVDDEQILSLYHDPRYEQGLILFIDARKDEEYRKGHIPGAYQLDPMPPSPEKYLAAVVGPCNAAQQIVIYCHGGDCELSEFAGELLRSVQIANDKIFIYAKGIPSWQARGLPMESGDRKSGQISNARQ